MTKDHPPKSKKTAKEEDLFKLSIGDHPCDAQSFDTIFHNTSSADEIKSILQKKKTHAGQEYHSSSKNNHFPRPQAELDLHGCSREEACRRTKNFIKTSQHHGRQYLRIITGKGLHSTQLPVLPEAVEEILGQFKKAGVVAAFRWEKKVRYKSGAVLVTLSPYGNHMGVSP